MRDRSGRWKQKCQSRRKSVSRRTTSESMLGTRGRYRSRRRCERKRDSSTARLRDAGRQPTRPRIALLGSARGRSAVRARAFGHRQAADARRRRPGRARAPHVLPTATPHGPRLARDHHGLRPPRPPGARRRFAERECERSALEAPRCVASNTGARRDGLWRGRHDASSTAHLRTVLGPRCSRYGSADHDPEVWTFWLRPGGRLKRSSIPVDI